MTVKLWQQKPDGCSCCCWAVLWWCLDNEWTADCAGYRGLLCLSCTVSPAHSSAELQCRLFLCGTHRGFKGWYTVSALLLTFCFLVLILVCVFVWICYVLVKNKTGKCMQKKLKHLCEIWQINKKNLANLWKWKVTQKNWHLQANLQIYKEIYRVEKTWQIYERKKKFCLVKLPVFLLNFNLRSWLFFSPFLAPWIFFLKFP